MTLFERAQAVSDVLMRIRQVRSSMYGANGWSWRAAGYTYDPDSGSWSEVARLEGELAELLDGVPTAGPDAQKSPPERDTPASYWR